MRRFRRGARPRRTRRGTVRAGNEAGADAAALECRDLREWISGGRQARVLLLGRMKWPQSLTRSTIFPTFAFDSIRRWALPASVQSKTESITGINLPSAHRGGAQAEAASG